MCVSLVFLSPSVVSRVRSTQMAAKRRELSRSDENDGDRVVARRGRVAPFAPEPLKRAWSEPLPTDSGGGIAYVHRYFTADIVHYKLPFDSITRRSDASSIGYDSSSNLCSAHRRCSAEEIANDGFLMQRVWIRVEQPLAKQASRFPLILRSNSSSDVMGEQRGVS